MLEAFGKALQNQAYLEGIGGQTEWLVWILDFDIGSRILIPSRGGLRLEERGRKNHMQLHTVERIHQNQGQ